MNPPNIKLNNQYFIESHIDLSPNKLLDTKALL